MGKPPKVTATPVAAAPAVALPIVDSIGIAKAPKGWVVVLVQTQGDKVLSREMLSVDAEPRAHAAMRAQHEVAKHFAMAKGGEA